jgi:hypothetical protein
MLIVMEPMLYAGKLNGSESAEQIKFLAMLFI